MSMSDLTSRQREVFEFIRDKITGRGYGPTVREIGDNFRISSPNGVMCHLKALEKKGLITREPNMSRAIQLTDAYKEERGMPLVGQIAAGNLSEAIEQADRFDFEEWFPQRKNQFALKVKGDSMIEAQIADGDIVICRRARTAHKGDIVVAITDEGEATLKYWYPEANRIRLQPANSVDEANLQPQRPGHRHRHRRRPQSGVIVDSPAILGQETQRRHAVDGIVPATPVPVWAGYIACAHC